MHIRPDFLSRTRGPDPAGTLEANADYSAHSDDWLLGERDRKQRQLDELTRHPDRSAVCSSWSASTVRSNGSPTS